MSLSECPFLYDIMGGSLKIWPSNGCCCIKHHFFVRISFTFGSDGRYCVTKGKIVFLCVFSVLFCFVSLEEGLCPFLKFHL